MSTTRDIFKPGHDLSLQLSSRRFQRLITEKWNSGRKMDFKRRFRTDYVRYRLHCVWLTHFCSSGSHITISLLVKWSGQSGYTWLYRAATLSSCRRLDGVKDMLTLQNALLFYLVGLYFSSCMYFLHSSLSSHFPPPAIIHPVLPLSPSPSTSYVNISKSSTLHGLKYLY